MAVEVRDVALEHYSASAVLVRFKSGDKVWLPLSQIEQMPGSWSIPASMSQSRGKHLVVTDWIAKQKGFKVAPRELDIDPERASEKSAAQAEAPKAEALVNGKPFAVAALEQQVERLTQERDRYLRERNEARTLLEAARQDLGRAGRTIGELRAGPNSERDKALADLALARDTLRKVADRADKAEAYIAAQGRADQHLPTERFALLELE